MHFFHHKVSYLYSLLIEDWNNLFVHRSWHLIQQRRMDSHAQFIYGDNAFLSWPQTFILWAKALFCHNLTTLLLLNSLLSMEVQLHTRLSPWTFSWRVLSLSSQLLYNLYSKLSIIHAYICFFFSVDFCWQFLWVFLPWEISDSISCFLYFISSI